MVSITQLETVHFGATVIYFLINTGIAYDNTVAVPFVPAGFVHSSGPRQAQGTLGCHTPACGMQGGWEEIPGGSYSTRQGKKYNIRNPAFVRTHFCSLGCCCCFYLFFAFSSFPHLHNMLISSEVLYLRNRVVWAWTEGFFCLLQTKTK